MTQHSTGYRSTGDRSTGNCSTGDRSTGNCSTGYRSTGNGSTGDWSAGNRSTGNCSTGNGSTGNGSTGDHSTGNWSTGNWSTGDCSTGNWSISDRSVGHFATEWGAPAGLFNQPMTREELDDVRFPGWLYRVTPVVWVRSEDMTDQERDEHPEHTTTEGCLRIIPMRDAWRKAWDTAPDDQRRAMLDLPHWDNAVFLEISGIDVEAELRASTVEAELQARPVEVTLTLTPEQLERVKAVLEGGEG